MIIDDGRTNGDEILSSVTLKRGASCRGRSASVFELDPRYMYELRPLWRTISHKVTVKVTRDSKGVDIG